MTLVRLIDVPVQRWRNGGGVTRELQVWPAAGDWQVRVSVADIETDAPFSPYPGVERWFTVLQGAGVALTIDSTTQQLVRGSEPLRFDGASTTHAHLIDGPTRDLNLMLRDASGSMQCVADEQAWSPCAAQCGLFTAVAGRCQADGFEAIEVPAYALLWFDDAPTSLAFSAGQRPAGLVGWWLAATPRKD